MPGKTATGGLAGKLNRKAFDAHKNDDTVYKGGGECPAGIENGVATLVECKFDQYKDGDLKGEYFFHAAGIIVVPKLHDGVPVLGLRTSITEPMCDTPNRSRKTQDEHVSWVLNELRKLGVDTTELDFDDLEAAVTTLKETGVHFRFRTWKGEPTKQYPNPRTNHQWQGVNGLEDFVLEDDTASAVVEHDVTTVPDVPKSTTPPKKKTAKEPEPEEEEEEEEEEESTDDLNALAVSADGGDDDAAIRLTELATAAGVSKKQIEAAKNWHAVVKLIPTTTETDEPVEDSVEPEVGEIWMYKVPGAKKPVECEVLSVDKSEQTVTLKNLDTNKPVSDKNNPKKKMNVPFSELSNG